ncbi:alpha/beta hydrolase [Amycolatopsis taiwanensis]|uniref:alpha/beta hydrolase n=1 Tax=Amycolatopsis taiwanensis TaxID=342230 RepID=UPI000485A4B2|nr:alpha/beta hydrolase [Amycolatopsis taiwanensis]
MVSLEQLLSLRPDSFGAAASAWRGLADSLAKHGTALRTGIREQLDHGSWAGHAGESARSHLDQLHAQYRRSESRLNSIAGTLHSAGGGLTTAQSALNQALGIARQAGLDVGRDGSVSWNLARSVDLLTNPTGPATIGRLAGQVSGLISQSLEHAAMVDNQTAAALGRLTPQAAPDPTKDVPERERDRTPEPSAPDPWVIPKGSAPAAVKDWWDNEVVKTMTPAQLDAYIKEHAAEIGALDGVPCAVRDQANRYVLADLRAQSRASLDELKAHEPQVNWWDWNSRDSHDQWQAEVDALQAKLGGLDALQARLDRPGDPPALLLGVDTERQGHAIVAINDPDKAKNVATLVPGIKTHLNAGCVNDYAQASENMVNTEPARGANTAVIAWMDYDAPDEAGAPFSDSAQHAAPDLNQFTEGLHVTHDPAVKPHLTLIGHSYGSTVLGEASKQYGGLGVDDVVAIGSPGMDVNSAADLNVSQDPPTPPPWRGHVWAGRNTNDVIQWGTDTTHGPSTTDRSFGANVFDTGWGSGNVSWDGEVGSHMSYWNQHSTSLRNLSAIISGNYSDVTVEGRPD